MFMQALFIVKLLQGPEYTWFVTQHYSLDRNRPSKLDWQKLNTDIKTYYRPADYVYKAH